MFMLVFAQVTGRFHVLPGDFVVVEPIAEGHKVQAEIVHILYPAQVKHLKQENLWYANWSGYLNKTITTPYLTLCNQYEL